MRHPLTPYLIFSLTLLGVFALTPQLTLAAPCPSQDISILQRFDTNRNNVIDDQEVTAANIAWTTGSPGAPTDQQMKAITAAWTSSCQIGGAGTTPTSSATGSSGLSETTPTPNTGTKPPRHIDGYGLGPDILNDLNGDGAFTQADCDLLSTSYYNPTTGQDLRKNLHFDFNHDGKVGSADIKACREALNSGGKVTAQGINGSAPMGDTVFAQLSAYIRVISINNTSATVAVAVNAPSLIGKLNQCSIRWGDGQNSVTANISPSLKEQQYTHTYPKQVNYVAVFSCSGPGQMPVSGQVVVPLSPQDDTLVVRIDRGKTTAPPINIDLRVVDVNAGHVTVSAKVSPVSAVAFCNIPNWGDGADYINAYISAPHRQTSVPATNTYNHDYQRSGSYVITWSCMSTTAQLAQRSVSVKVDVPRVSINDKTGNGVAAQAAELDQGTGGGNALACSLQGLTSSGKLSAPSSQIPSGCDIIRRIVVINSQVADTQNYVSGLTESDFERLGTRDGVIINGETEVVNAQTTCDWVAGWTLRCCYKNNGDKLACSTDQCNYTSNNQCVP